MEKPKPQRKGRPVGSGRGLDHLIHVRVPLEMLEGLDALAGGRMDRPDRATVVREIIAKALQTAVARGKG